MDTHPLTSPSNALTNCLNGTLITYNGNEFILQNDMGNTKVETAALPDGYIPVGIKSYGGIIYVASYNPLTDESQIGSFPSPERIISSDEAPEGTKTSLTISKVSLSNFICDSSYKFRYGDTYRLELEGKGLSSLITNKYTKVAMLYVSNTGSLVGKVLSDVNEGDVPDFLKTTTTAYYEGSENGYIIGNYDGKHAGKVALSVNVCTPEYVNFTKIKYLRDTDTTSTFSCTVSGVIKDVDGKTHSFSTPLKWEGITSATKKGAELSVPISDGVNILVTLLIDNHQPVTVEGDSNKYSEIQYNLTTQLKVTLNLSVDLPGCSAQGVRNSALEGSGRVFFNSWKFLATDAGTAVTFGVTTYPEEGKSMTATIDFFDINAGKDITDSTKPAFTRTYEDCDGTYTMISYIGDKEGLLLRHAYLARIRMNLTTIAWRYVLCTSLFNDYYYTEQDFINLEPIGKIEVGWDTEWKVEQYDNNETVTDFFLIGNSNKKPTLNVSYSGDLQATVTYNINNELYPFDIDVSKSSIKCIYDTKNPALNGLTTYAERIAKAKDLKLVDDGDAMKWQFDIDGNYVEGNYSGSRTFEALNSKLGSEETLVVNNLFLPAARLETLMLLFGCADWDLSTQPYVLPFTTKHNDTGRKDTARFHLSRRLYNETTNSVAGNTTDCIEYRSTAGTTRLLLSDFPTQLTACIGATRPIFSVLSGGSETQARKGLSGGDFIGERFATINETKHYQWYNILMSYEGGYKLTNLVGGSDMRVKMLGIRDKLANIYVNCGLTELTVKRLTDATIDGYTGTTVISALVDPQASLKTVNNLGLTWATTLANATNTLSGNSDVAKVRAILNCTLYYRVLSENTPNILVKIATNALEKAITTAFSKGVNKAYAELSHTNGEAVSRFVIKNTLVPTKVYYISNGSATEAKQYIRMNSSGLWYAIPSNSDLSGSIGSFYSHNHNDFIAAEWLMHGSGFINLTWM